MFTLNLSKIMADFPLRKEKADMVIRTWKAEHKDVYADFKYRIDAVSNGDLSVLFEMYALMKECVPAEAQSFYEWFISLQTQAPSCASALTAAHQQWAGEYTEKIAQCIVNRKLWLGINLRTGVVDIYTSRQRGLLMVRSGTPLEIWQRLPQYMKSHFIEQLDKLTRNSKGCMLFSRLERKQLYQALAFFANIFNLAHAVFMPDFLANLYDKVIEHRDPLAYCMYYFVMFDHGLPHMAKILDTILIQDEIDENALMLIRNAIHMLVSQSMEMGTETKATWEKAIEGSNPEIWKDVMFALHKAKGKRGKKKTVCTLDEILKGDTIASKQKIRQFLDEHTDDICLAYLLRSLVQAGKINVSIPYMTFHRAIELFVKRKISYDVPQKRYGELKALSLRGTPYNNSLKRATRIMDEWICIFAETG